MRVGGCVFVGGSVTCIDPHQTGFVDKGSDHLQLIKFCPSFAPGKGVCGGAKIFGMALLQPTCSVCMSSECFFISTNLHYFSIIFSIILFNQHFKLQQYTINWLALYLNDTSSVGPLVKTAVRS